VPLGHAALARHASLTAVATVPDGRPGTSPPTAEVQARREVPWRRHAPCPARGWVRVQVATPMEDGIEEGPAWMKSI
jgi:hypothetical protein